MISLRNLLNHSRSTKVEEGEMMKRTQSQRVKPGTTLCSETLPVEDRTKQQHTQQVTETRPVESGFSEATSQVVNFRDVFFF